MSRIRRACPPTQVLPKMRSSELLSEKWCDLVFENRNRAYGAYRLRAQAGRRYRRALGVVGGSLALMLATYVGVAAYVRYRLANDVADAEELLAKLRPTDLKEGYKVKFLATARQVAPKRMTPGARQQAPEIVDGMPPLHSIGTDGPIAYNPEEEMIVTPIIDTTGLHDETLPVAKQKVVPTDRISQMPQFPGGPRAFMRWLDEHIPYPASCLQKKQQGVVLMSFVVGTDGYVADLEVKDAFDEAVLKTIRQAAEKMPKWQPGTNEWGEPAPVKITVPVAFKI